MADFDQAYFDSIAQQNPDFWQWKQSINPDVDANGNSRYWNDEMGVQHYNAPQFDNLGSHTFTLADGRTAGFNGQNYFIDGGMGQGGAGVDYYDAAGNVASHQDPYWDNQSIWENPLTYGLLAFGGLAAAGYGAGAAGAAEGTAGTAAGEAGGYTAADYAAADAAGGMVPEYGSAAAYDGAVAGTSAPAFSANEIAAANNAYAANAATASPNYLSAAQSLGKALLPSGGAAAGGSPALGGMAGGTGLSTPAAIPQGVSLMPKFDTSPNPLKGYSDELGNSQNVIKLAQALRNPYGSY